MIVNEDSVILIEEKSYRFLNIAHQATKKNF